MHRISLCVRLIFHACCVVISALCRMANDIRTTTTRKVGHRPPPRMNVSRWADVERSYTCVYHEHWLQRSQVPRKLRCSPRAVCSYSNSHKRISHQGSNSPRCCSLRRSCGGGRGCFTSRNIRATDKYTQITLSWIYYLQ